VEFFDGILENNLRVAQQTKEMLVPRFQSEQGGAVGDLPEAAERAGGEESGGSGARRGRARAGKARGAREARKREHEKA
jgi:hypothetical protein